MTHESIKTPRYIFIALLLSLVAYAFYAALEYSPVFGFVGLLIIFVLVFIRFKKVELRSNKLIYTDRSILPVLNGKKVIHFNSISSIETDPGYFDKTFFLFDVFFNTGGYRGNTRPARITFKLHSGETYSIVEFGRKKGFEGMVERIERAV